MIECASVGAGRRTMLVVQGVTAAAGAVMVGFGAAGNVPLLVLGAAWLVLAVVGWRMARAAFDRVRVAPDQGHGVLVHLDGPRLHAVVPAAQVSRVRVMRYNRSGRYLLSLKTEAHGTVNCFPVAGGPAADAAAALRQANPALR